MAITRLPYRGHLVRESVNINLTWTLFCAVWLRIGVIAGIYAQVGRS